MTSAMRRVGAPSIPGVDGDDRRFRAQMVAIAKDAYTKIEATSRSLDDMGRQTTQRIDRLVTALRQEICEEIGKLKDFLQAEFHASLNDMRDSMEMDFQEVLGGVVADFQAKLDELAPPPRPDSSGDELAPPMRPDSSGEE